MHIIICTLHNKDTESLNLMKNEHTPAFLNTNACVLTLREYGRVVYSSITVLPLSRCCWAVKYLLPLPCCHPHHMPTSASVLHSCDLDTGVRTIYDCGLDSVTRSSMLVTLYSAVSSIISACISIHRIWPWLVIISVVFLQKPLFQNQPAANRVWNYLVTRWCNSKLEAEEMLPTSNSHCRIHCHIHSQSQSLSQSQSKL